MTAVVEGATLYTPSSSGLQSSTRTGYNWSSTYLFWFRIVLVFPEVPSAQACRIDHLEPADPSYYYSADSALSRPTLFVLDNSSYVPGISY